MSFWLPLPLSALLLATAACGGDSNDGANGNGAMTPEGMACVRNDALDEGNTSGRFLDNEDETVCDKATGLTWQQVVLQNPVTWQDADEYCAELALPGSEWRVPAFSELRSIVDTDLRPAIDLTAFPTTPPEPFWTSTLMDPPFDDEAYAIDFADGSGGSALIDENSLLVRCVR